MCGVDQVERVVGAGEEDGLGGCAVGERKRESLECRGERVGVVWSGRVACEAEGCGGEDDRD